MTPAVLLLRHHAGDPTAGNALVREFENIARTAAYRWRRSWIDEADLLQTARIAIWNAIDPAASTPYDPNLGALVPWLRSAANSALYRYVRDNGKKQRPLVSLDDPLREGEDLTRGDLLPATDLPADEALAEHEHAALVRSHLDKLAGRQGEILRRRYAGETLEEIGVDLGVTRERIRQREVRALESVRRMLAARGVV